MLQGREEKQVLSENWLRILRRLANVRTTKVSGDIALYADVCSSGSECFQREGQWGWLPRQAFPSLEETPPGFGPDQAPFCSLKRGRTEGSLEMKSPLGGTLGRWQVARGSFCMKNHELTVAGMKQWQVRQQHRASWKLGSTLVETQKALVKEAMFLLAEQRQPRFS